MTKLQLAPGLSLPLDAVTQTFLVVGKRGSGKSNTAARLVEQLHHAGIPFVVLDPVDTWWGLKASRDGGKGLDVYVFGGRHADLPLEPGEKSGALIADVLCEHRLPMVLSVKHLSGRERSTFMVAFAQTLFQKWAGGPLHIVLEEAHELAPQNVQNAKEGEQQMLGAFKRLWKLGRSSGIGGTAITQRPASLSKDITTQSEILIAHRTIGPQDVKAIGEWIKYHGEQSEILGELPSLPTGVAYVWAPEFPEAKPIGLKRIEVALRETYDSASTPKVGEHRVEPKELAPVDLERLRVKMAATIEKAKAEDPKELRKEIARLKGELGKAGKQAPAKATAPDPAKLQETVDRAVVVAVAEERTRLTRDYRAMSQALTSARKALASALRVAGEFDGAIAALDLAAEQINASIKSPAPATQPVRHASRVAAPVRVTPPAGARDRPARAIAETNGALGGLHARTLNALAELDAIGVPVADRDQLGFYVGVTYAKGYGARTAGELKTQGLIEYPRPGQIRLTDAGRAHVGDIDPPSSLGDLHNRIRFHLGGLHERVFLHLTQADQDYTISRDLLGEQMGVTFDKGYGARTLGELKTAGVVVYPTPGMVAPSDLLFPEGLN